MSKYILIFLCSLSSLSFGMSKDEENKISFSDLQSQWNQTLAKLDEFNAQYPDWQRDPRLRKKHEVLFDKQRSLMNQIMLGNVVIPRALIKPHACTNNQSIVDMEDGNSDAGSEKKEIKCAKDKPVTDSASEPNSKKRKLSALDEKQKIDKEQEIARKLHALDVKQSQLFEKARGKKGKELDDIADQADAIEDQKAQLLKERALYRKLSQKK